MIILSVLFCVSQLVFSQKKQKSLPQKLTGIASYYANKFEGRKTASGAVFRNSKLTAACNKLPFGTRVKVINLKNKKSVEVIINDRLARWNKRVVDLTYAAAKKIGMIKSGITEVEVIVLSN